MFPVHAWGVVFGGSCHAPRAGAPWSQSLKKNMIVGGSILAVAGLGPASDGPCERQAACVQRLSLRWGLLPRTDGRETLGRARCAHSGKGALSVQPPETLLEQARGSRSARAREEEGERVLQQQRHLARGTAKRASCKVLSPCHSKQNSCNMPLSLLRQLRRRRVHRRVRCCVRASRRSTAEGLVAWFRPNPTTPYCLPMQCL
jgi:hypothetical protein